jgi:hypothetical protein
VSVLFNQVPYDTTQPYRHGQDIPGRSVPASPDRPNAFLPSAYNDPDPPSAQNYFAEEGRQEQQQQEQHHQHSTGSENAEIQGRDMLDIGTPTLLSSVHSTPERGPGVPLPRPNQTPKQSHAQARGL